MFDNNKRNYWPTYDWRVSKPFDQGMNTEVLFNLFNHIQTKNIAVNSMLIIRNGYIVAEGNFHPFNKDSIEQINCLTKPFTATLVGILIQEGKIKDVNQKVLDFFDSRNVANTSIYKSDMTIKDLLTNTTGCEWGDVINNESGEDARMVLEMYSSDDWGKFCFDRAVIYKPGTFFASTSPGCQILASIIKKVIGMSAHDYAKEKLFKPLGIKDTAWFTSISNESTGSQGLAMALRDTAKLGLLFLSNGYWDNNLIINEKWIKAATSVQCETRDIHKREFIIGYGYHWFILSGLPYYTYCAFGMFGHALLVVKDLDLICVISASLPVDQQRIAVYQLFKNYVIPSCVDFDKNEDSKIYRRFQDFLYSIEFPEPGNYLISTSNFISDIIDLKYKFDQENSFIFIESFFAKFKTKTLTFKFINTKVCKLEVITFCDHYFIIQISLNSNYLITKVMTDNGEVLISAKGRFETDSTFNIDYFTNFRLKNTIKVSMNEINCLECDVSNFFTKGIIKGYLAR